MLFSMTTEALFKNNFFIAITMTVSRRGLGAYLLMGCVLLNLCKLEESNLKMGIILPTSRVIMRIQ